MALPVPGAAVEACRDPAACSPCVKVCRLGPDGQCLGCARTADEIARWPLMSPAERAAVLAELQER